MVAFLQGGVLLGLVLVVAACSSDEVCEHPEVKKECAGGYCTIPSGCFVQGLVEEELCVDKGLNTGIREVRLTRSFEISQMEISRSEYRVVLKDAGPSEWGQSRCVAGTCPATVSWTEAVSYCNALSEQMGLPRCYSCGFEMRRMLTHPTPQKVWVCDVESKAAFFGCRGYRLPSEAEWEYAARGGTNTELFSGRLDRCDGTSAQADAVAWYKANSGAQLRPTGQKIPNAWGLFDTAGNAKEWVHDALDPAYDIWQDPTVNPADRTKVFMETLVANRTQAITDPLVERDRIGAWATAVSKGASHAAEPHELRPTAYEYSPTGARGFRCVRTVQ